MAPLIEIYNTDHAAIVTYVCRTYGLIDTIQHLNPHRMRREAIARRLRLYRDQATKDVEGIIDLVYETEEYKRTVKKFIPVALEQNVTRRIVNEVASLYDRPALRILSDEAQNKRFHAEEKRLSLHFIHQEAHRLTNLCNEVLIWQFKGVDDQTALRIVTPDCFDAIPHPQNMLVPAAFLFNSDPATVLQGEDRARLPHYEIWDDTYRYRINAHGHMVDAKGTLVSVPEEHGLGRIPGVLFHRREPTTCILDSHHGSDIESAHRGVALLNVMIMRLSKVQGENQPILAGNLAAMASGQVLNGEKPLLLPPEVVASMLDMKTDPDHYLAVKKDKISSVGASYGLDYQLFMQELGGDSGSGKSYQVRREKLTELRLEQRGRAVFHEELVVQLMGFKTDGGFRVDYQEQAIPQDAMEEIDLLEKKMAKGLDSPISYLMRKDPDLSYDEAVLLLKGNLKDYAGLVQWVRALNVPENADANNPGKSPQENGASRPNEQKTTEPDYKAIARSILNAA